MLKGLFLSGNDNDAKTVSCCKSKLEDKRTALSNAYEAAAQNASKMRSMHDKLVKDIQELNSRRDAIKAKLAVAKTQEKD